MYAAPDKPITPRPLRHAFLIFSRRPLRQPKTLAAIVVALSIIYILTSPIQAQLCATFASLGGGAFCAAQMRTADFDLFEHLGGNGPWIAKRQALGYYVDEVLPGGCVVDQVHMLARHAERYPTKNAGNRHLALLERLRAPGVTPSGSLSFLNTWTYFTNPSDPAFENLTTTGPYAGTLQARNTGLAFRSRYDHLISRARPTRFWSCGAPRDVETARYFADGFFGTQWERDGTAELQVIPEDPHRGADTLTPGDTCFGYLTDIDGHDLGYQMLELFQRTFAPAIAARLAPELRGVELSDLDVYGMMEMCGFEVLARGYSSWCGVFTHDEWRQFEYARDLLHYYRAGPGNQYAPAMGWVWLNATSSLLANDSSKDVYFSFVHDGDVVPLLAALQILDEKTITQDLPTDRIKENRVWRTSDVVPMGGRVVLERVACGKEEEEQRKYLRIFINDGLMRMAGLPAAKEVRHAVKMEDFIAFVHSRLELFGDFKSVCGLRDEAPGYISFLHQ